MLFLDFTKTMPIHYEKTEEKFYFSSLINRNLFCGKLDCRKKENPRNIRGFLRPLGLLVLLHKSQLIYNRNCNYRFRPSFFHF